MTAVERKGMGYEGFAIRLTVWMAVVGLCTACGEGISSPLPPECIENVDCVGTLISQGYHLACGVPRCQAHVCVMHTTTEQGNPCDDERSCTMDTACSAGRCKGNALDCDDGNDCTDDQCSNLLGNCIHAPNALLPCDDGISCTTGDGCDVTGACRGTPTNECGCLSDFDCPDNPVGDMCVGRVLCNQDYRCESDPLDLKVCEAGLCVTATCDPATGECLTQPWLDGHGCDDGDPCTGKDICLFGVCTGEPLDCDDNEPCTVDSCEPDNLCAHAPVSAGYCDDGNPCTLMDICQKGVCQGEAKGCDSTTCFEGHCDPADGSCTYDMVDGLCDDGDVCTADDGCDQGLCVGGGSVCDDDDVCTMDSCNVLPGGLSCDYTPVVGGCEDGDPCTISDTCVGGQCITGDNICGCETAEDCEDPANLCVSQWLCVFSGPGSACVPDPGTLSPCVGDASPCNAFACAPKTGVCEVVPIQDGILCNDDDPCTVADFCVGGACVGDAKDCEDGDPCTGNPCEDGNCGTVALVGGEQFLTTDFETGLPEGWTVSGNMAWLAGVAFAGNGSTQGMGVVQQAGDTLIGTTTLESPELWLYGATLTLRFSLWLELNNSVPPPVACTASPRYILVRLRRGLLIETLGCWAIDTQGWETVEVDLSGLANTKLHLQFVFVSKETADVVVKLDDVVLSGIHSCPGGQLCAVGLCQLEGCATTEKNCDDDNPCTADSCDPLDGECQVEWIDGFCNDGDPCTVEDTCKAGVCQGKESPACP